MYDKFNRDMVIFDKETGEILSKIPIKIYINNIKSTVDLSDLIVIPFRSNDGVKGIDMFRLHQKILKGMFKEIEYMESMYENSSSPRGVLQTQQKIGKDVMEKLKVTWSKLYEGSKNAGKVAVLDNGLEFKPIFMSPTDLDMIKSREHNNKEAEKIYGLPKGMLSSDRDNIEQIQGYFKIKTIEPILALMEQAINKALLLEDEKEDGYYFKFDTTQLDLMNGKDFVETVISKVKGGLMTINEARAIFDYNDFADSDELLLSLGNVLKKMDGSIHIPNIGTILGVDGKEKTTKEGEELEKV